MSNLKIIQNYEIIEGNKITELYEIKKNYTISESMEIISKSYDITNNLYHISNIIKLVNKEKDNIYDVNFRLLVIKHIDDNIYIDALYNLGNILI